MGAHLESAQLYSVLYDRNIAERDFESQQTNKQLISVTKRLMREMTTLDDTYLNDKVSGERDVGILLVWGILDVGNYGNDNT